MGDNGSPFVKVFSIMGIPGAASIINFVVLTAAFSAMNSLVYIESYVVQLIFTKKCAGFSR